MYTFREREKKVWIYVFWGSCKFLRSSVHELDTFFIPTRLTWKNWVLDLGRYLLGFCFWLHGKNTVGGWGLEHRRKTRKWKRKISQKEAESEAVEWGESRNFSSALAAQKAVVEASFISMKSVGAHRSKESLLWKEWGWDNSSAGFRAWWNGWKKAPRRWIINFGQMQMGVTNQRNWDFVIHLAVRYQDLLEWLEFSIMSQLK